MGFLTDVFHWFTASAHWHGTNGIPHRLYEHTAMSLGATAAAIAIALPLGVLLGHGGRHGVGGRIGVNISNLGRAVPSLGILYFLAVAIGLRGYPGFGARPALVAMVALAIPPIVTNTYIGVGDVDPEAREAAVGMGMTGWQVLRRVELPLALPLVMAGIRTSAVQVVATATLAALTAWGGLGRYIVDGFSQFDNVQLFSGALLVALLAIVTEVVLGVVQRGLTPGGLEPRGQSGKPEAGEPAAQPAVLAPPT